MSVVMSAWERKQATFFLEQEKSRAEPCECGHMRGAHMDDVAACHACRDCFRAYPVLTQGGCE